MSDEPTPHAIARDLKQVDQARRDDRAQIEARLDREYAQLRASMDRGFERVSMEIAQLQVVHPEHFAADQRRQDEAIASNENRIRDTRKELVSLRRQMVSSFLSVIAVTVVAAVLASAIG